VVITCRLVLRGDFGLNWSLRSTTRTGGAANGRCAINENGRTYWRRLTTGNSHIFCQTTFGRIGFWHVLLVSLLLRGVLVLMGTIQ